MGALDLAPVEERWIESPVGNEPIQAWVARPPAFDPERSYPLILEIHGGPHTAYGPHFSSEIQLYAAAGYVVLYVNPRGSTSYGERFANLIHHNYPGEDYDDLMAAVDALLAEGYVDEERLYVTGGSGGGVLTAWIVGKTDRFRAAVVAKPVINWASFVLTADISPYVSRYWFPVPPWEDPEHYLEAFAPVPGGQGDDADSVAHRRVRSAHAHSRDRTVLPGAQAARYRHGDGAYPGGLPQHCATALAAYGQGGGGAGVVCSLFCGRSGLGVLR